MNVTGIRWMLTTGAVMLLTAGPGAAAGKFAPPAGCEVFATVQMRNCQVSQHYRCSGDAAGDQWALYMDGDGPFYLSRIDRETRWLESFDLNSGEADRLVSEVDPASFTTMLSGGRDDYDFRTESSTGEVRRYTGHDTLTGETVMIDGVALERTRFFLEAQAEDGSFIWRRRGEQFIHRDWRLFWADHEEFENAFGDKETVVDTPMQISQPGQKGYLASEPIFDCGEMLTQAGNAVVPVRGGTR